MSRNQPATGATGVNRQGPLSVPTSVARWLAVLLPLCTVCACEPQTSTPPGVPDAPAGPDRLSGTIEGRPFTAAVAFAENRHNSKTPSIDIFVYERHATKEAGCDRLAKDWKNGERAMWIQMDWPDRQGRTWDTHDVSEGAPGVFFTLSRVDRSSERVEGDVTVVDVRDDGGTLRLDVVSDNDRDTKIRGAVAGTIDFTICPDAG